MVQQYLSIIRAWLCIALVADKRPIVLQKSDESSHCDNTY